MTAEQYCNEMRKTNIEQRDLILEAIHRIFSEQSAKPIQIFLTGPAGCGKTFTMRLLMETYNRFSIQHNSNYNAYIASASTGMAATAINGSAVHSAFRISNNNSSRERGLSFELLNLFRIAFNNISIVFIDECSMIGSGLFQQINARLQQILYNFEDPFGNMNMIICGDLRQLPPVCQTPIYKLRLFFRTNDVIAYNNQAIHGDEVIEYPAQDLYTGHKNLEQLNSARSKVHKMKPDETGGLPYLLRLMTGKPYMVRANIDVNDGIVNGAIGTLCYIERNNDQSIKRLWLLFKDNKIGKIIRTKCSSSVHSNSNLSIDWTPLSHSTTNINLKSKLLHCKRKQFPLVESCAITIHKSQGGTYDTLSHDQQLVYVALSRTMHSTAYT